MKSNRYPSVIATLTRMVAGGDEQARKLKEGLENGSMTINPLPLLKRVMISGSGTLEFFKDNDQVTDGVSNIDKALTPSSGYTVVTGLKLQTATIDPAPTSVNRDEKLSKASYGPVDTNTDLLNAFFNFSVNKRNLFAVDIPVSEFVGNGSQQEENLFELPTAKLLPPSSRVQFELRPGTSVSLPATNAMELIIDSVIIESVAKV